MHVNDTAVVYWQERERYDVIVNGVKDWTYGI